MLTADYGLSVLDFELVCLDRFNAPFLCLKVVLPIAGSHPGSVRGKLSVRVSRTARDPGTSMRIMSSP
jgi:hypothetical protein